jgi:hypothetical protein
MIIVLPKQIGTASGLPVFLVDLSDPIPANIHTCIISCGRGFVGKRRNIVPVRIRGLECVDNFSDPSTISTEPVWTNEDRGTQYIDMGGKWLDSFGGPPETICVKPFPTRESAERACMRPDPIFKPIGVDKINDENARHFKELWAKTFFPTVDLEVAIRAFEEINK